MSMTCRSRTGLASVVLTASLAAGLTSAAPVAAAPYTVDAVVTVSTTNPAIGATLTIYLFNFQPGELIDIDLHSSPVRLATVTADADGNAVATVTLPSNFICEHSIVATGRSSGEVARTDILIGPPSACAGGGNTGSGNTGRGNVGYGNTGDNNTGHGNTGDNNTGHGNTGNRNTGDGNVSDGNTGWGNVGYSTDVAAATRESSPVEVSSVAAIAAVLGLAAVSTVGFARRRRQG